MQETEKQEGPDRAGLVRSGEEFGFYFKYNGDSLMSCKWDII